MPEAPASDAIVETPEPVVRDDTIRPEPVADGPAETPADDSAESAPETTEQQEAKKQSKFQRRLERHKTRAVAAETEARLLREQLADLKARDAKQPEGQEPKRDDFDSYEDYLEARADWRADQKIDAALKTRDEAQQGRERQSKASDKGAETAKQWNAREQAFEAQTKDYQEVVAAFVEEDIGSFSVDARQAIVESDIGPQLLYHLASHPDIAERIADLSPVRQIAELGKLEAAMAKAPRKPSNAPEPITPVNQGRNAAQGYRENMSDAEYRAWRKSNGATWAR